MNKINTINKIRVTTGGMTEGEVGCLASCEEM